METDDEWERQQREWDEYREQRQREWDAWEAEQEAEMIRRKGKATYRRERDDRSKGYLDNDGTFNDNLNDFDQWEEFVSNGRTEWRLRDPTVQPRYDELSRKDEEYKGNANYADTRQTPRQIL